MMNFQEAIAAIAQGAINIDSGITEIQADSRVHRGMDEICRIVTEKPEYHAAEELLVCCEMAEIAITQMSQGEALTPLTVQGRLEQVRSAIRNGRKGKAKPLGVPALKVPEMIDLIREMREILNASGFRKDVVVKADALLDEILGGDS